MLQFRCGSGGCLLEAGTPACGARLRGSRSFSDLGISGSGGFSLCALRLERPFGSPFWEAFWGCRRGGTCRSPTDVSVNWGGHQRKEGAKRHGTAMPSRPR